MKLKKSKVASDTNSDDSGSSVESEIEKCLSHDVKGGANTKGHK